MIAECIVCKRRLTCLPAGPFDEPICLACMRDNRAALKETLKALPSKGRSGARR